MNRYFLTRCFCSFAFRWASHNQVMLFAKAAGGLYNRSLVIPVQNRLGQPC